MSSSKSGQDLVAALASVAGKASPTQIVDVTRQLVSDLSEWRKVESVEQTNREMIAAQRDVWITKIRADREVMQQYLRQHEATQSKTLDELFTRLDKAIDGGNVDVVGQILEGIVSTVKSSPLGDLATLDKRMVDGSFTFKLGRS